MNTMLEDQVIEMYEDGYNIEDICVKLKVDLASVVEIVQELEYYDDSMDGDFDSAMASAGYGTDEDYGYYGE